MISKILSLLKPYKYTIVSSLIAIVCFVCMCCAINSCSNANKKANNNLKALTDTIKYYKTKSGEIIASKTLLEGDLSTLRLVNDSLYKVIKDMNVKNPDAIVHVKNTIDNGKHDTIWIITKETLAGDSIIIRDTIFNSTIDSIKAYKKDFAFNNKYRELEGYVFYADSILGLQINKDKIYFDYTLALKNNLVYIKSNNPYVQYNEITGLIIPKYRKKWSIGIGPQVGYGYNFVAKKVNPYIGLGITLQYNLISW